MVLDTSLKLPPEIVGPTELIRLRHEVEKLDNFMLQVQLRQNGIESPKLPASSRLLKLFVETNSLNLLHENDRIKSRTFLDSLQQHAPVIHISFASDPSPGFVNKIVLWLRQNINPLILIQIGLQPTLAIGCVVRTINHSYDLSLRPHFATKRQLLINELETVVNK